MTPQAPRIHRNGTSGDALLDQVVTAGGALRTAMDALSAAAPNQRDYYPLPPEAWHRAQAEFHSRAERLRSVYLELQDLAEAIADGSAEVRS